MKRTVILLAILALGAAGGTTDISLESRWAFDLGDIANGMLAVDLDDDGLVDLLRWQRQTSTVTAWRNPGDGTLVTEELPKQTWAPRSFTSGDLNGDGLTDLVESGERVGGLGAIGTWINDGAGGYSVTWGEADADHLLPPLDMDDDGDLDVVAFGAVRVSMRIFWNDGAGGLSSADPFDLQDAYAYPVLGDLNGDRLPDIVASEGDRIVSHANLGGGAFGEAVVILERPVTDFALADFDGDGHLDVVCYWREFSSHPEAVPPGLYSARGRGDGTFEPEVYHEAGASRFLYGSYLWAGDFDDDGDIDLATDAAASLMILPNPGDGSFGACTVLNLYVDDAYRRALALYTGEFDGEEGTDLFALHYTDDGQVLTASHAVPPTITEITPFRILENGSREVTIRGTGFDSNSTIFVPHGLTVSNIQHVDSGHLIVTIDTPEKHLIYPHGTSYELSVVNPSGQAAWVLDALQVYAEFDTGLSFTKGKIFTGRNEKKAWRIRASGAIDTEGFESLFEEMKKGFTLVFGDPEMWPMGWVISSDDPHLKISRSGNKIKYRFGKYLKFTIRRTADGNRFKLSAATSTELGLYGRIYVGIKAGEHRVLGEDLWPEVKERVFKMPKDGGAK